MVSICACYCEHKNCICLPLGICNPQLVTGRGSLICSCVHVGYILQHICTRILYMYACKVKYEDQVTIGMLDDSCGNISKLVDLYMYITQW
jgi:hypothetical protein